MSFAKTDMTGSVDGRLVGGVPNNVPYQGAMSHGLAPYRC